MKLSWILILEADKEASLLERNRANLKPRLWCRGLLFYLLSIETPLRFEALQNFIKSLYKDGGFSISQPLAVSSFLGMGEIYKGLQVNIFGRPIRMLMYLNYPFLFCWVSASRDAYIFVWYCRALVWFRIMTLYGLRMGFLVAEYT